MIQTLADMQGLADIDINALDRHLTWMRFDAREKSQIWQDKLFITESEENSQDLKTERY